MNFEEIRVILFGTENKPVGESELQQFDKELTERYDACTTQSELTQLMQEISKSPLYAEWVRVMVPSMRAMLKEGMATYIRGLKKDTKPNLPIQLMHIIKELAVVYGTYPENNLTFQAASTAEESHQELLQAKRVLKSAQKRVKAVERKHQGALLDLGLQLVWRCLDPYKQTILDPATWSLTLTELIEAAKESFKWDLSASQIRYYSRLGLIPRPVRVGEKGKALYPPTTLLRLGIVRKGQSQGIPLAEIQKAMPDNFKRNVIEQSQHLDNPYFYLERIASPGWEKWLRQMMYHIVVN